MLVLNGGIILVYCILYVEGCVCEWLFYPFVLGIYNSFVFSPVDRVAYFIPCAMTIYYFSFCGFSRSPFLPAWLRFTSSAGGFRGSLPRLARLRHSSNTTLVPKAEADRFWLWEPTRAADMVFWSCACICVLRCRTACQDGWRASRCGYICDEEVLWR